MKRLELKLKDEGLRFTEARRQVFGALESSSKALSAKEIHESLQSTFQGSADLVSVYRNLELFQKLGMVHEVFSGKFAVCEHGGHGGDTHVHVVSVCEQCGESSEIEDHASELCKTLNSLKASAPGLNEVKSVTLRGLCMTCKSTNAS